MSEREREVFTPVKKELLVNYVSWPTVNEDDTEVPLFNTYYP